MEEEALAQVFSCGFSEIFKNTFFTEKEHFWTTTSVFNMLFLHEDHLSLG